MKKDRKILAERVVDYVINKSTIANGLKALYLQSDASLLQLTRVDQRIASAIRNEGLTTKENPELGALREYYLAVKRAEHYFFEFIDKMTIDATWGSNDGENKALSYGNWQADSNNLARMILLIIDRTYHDFDQMEKIFAFLESLESHGQFDDNDFKYFKVNYIDEEEN